MDDRTESGEKSKNITANMIKSTDDDHSDPEGIWWIKEKEFNLKLNNTRIKTNDYM